MCSSFFFEGCSARWFAQLKAVRDSLTESAKEPLQTDPKDQLGSTRICCSDTVFHEQSVGQWKSLHQSHGAVVCGSWQLALRHSCLPPPPFSALQWDHVVLLISQQWLYSLACTSVFLNVSPSTLSLPTLAKTCNTLYKLIFTTFTTRSFTGFLSCKLTQLFGSLAVTGQLSEFH